MPIHSDDARAFHEHIEQMTAAPGESRAVIPPFPTLDNIEFTDEELIKIGRLYIETLRKLVADAE